MKRFILGLVAGILFTSFIGSVGVAFAADSVAFPVTTQQFAEKKADGFHWIYKASFRGREIFIDLGPACPQSSNEAAGVLGGSPYWAVIPGTNNSGWKYDGPETTVIPPFGVLDHPGGRAFAGQVVKATVATFWCNP